MKRLLLIAVVLFLTSAPSTIAQQQSVTQTFTLTVTATTLGITTASLPNVVVGTAYPSTALTATGGVAPYTWTATGLPAGMSTTGATLGGTPTATGSFTVTLTVKDSETTPQSKSQTFTINVAALLVVNPVTLPSATIGTVYSQPIPVTGGTAPYTCALSSTSGPLPAGLSVAGGASGCTVSGTPTGTTGSFTVTVKVTDSGK